MKCMLCNERNGSTRCEGCQELYCLSCMNKHHEELVQQFQLVMDIRNELKQSLNIVESTSKDNKEVPCIIEIDHWEREIIQRIRNIATKARTTVNEIMKKNIIEVRQQFEKLSTDIQGREKEGNYLENDISTMKIQLEQLRNDIEHVDKAIHVDFTISRNIEWNTLIHVVEEDLSSQATSTSAQRINQKTKEKKKTSDRNIYANLPEDTSSLSMTMQNVQVTKGQPNLVQKRIPVLKTDPSSNPINFEQRTNTIRPCIVCKNYFDDLSSTGLCSKCNYDTKRSSPHQIINMRQPPPNIYPSVYKNSEFLNSLSSPLKMTGPQKTVCSHCRNMNMIDNVQHGKEYRCAICQTILRL